MGTRICDPFQLLDNLEGERMRWKCPTLVWRIWNFFFPLFFSSSSPYNGNCLSFFFWKIKVFQLPFLKCPSFWIILFFCLTVSAAIRPLTFNFFSRNSADAFFAAFLLCLMKLTNRNPSFVKCNGMVMAAACKWSFGLASNKGYTEMGKIIIKKQRKKKNRWLNMFSFFFFFFFF